MPAHRHVLGAQDEARGARRRDDHVDVGERGGEAVELQTVTAEARGERTGGVGRPVGDVGDRRAARRQVGRCELADPAGADQQHAPAVELAEHLRRERRGSRRDRGRALTDRGLAPNALAERQRLAEDPVEQPSGRDGLERSTHLAEDLAFARDERVEPRRHPEQVQGGVLVVQTVEHVVERLAGKRGQCVCRVLLETTAEIDLGAVARREADSVTERTGEGRGRVGLERHPLAQLDRCDVMRQPDQSQLR